LAAAHLAEVLDGNDLAVHLEAEVPRPEVGHAVALAIGHHRLDVDHPHVDLLAEDARRRFLRRRLLLRHGRQRGTQSHEGQGRQAPPCCAQKFHLASSFHGAPSVHPGSCLPQHGFRPFSFVMGYRVFKQGVCRGFRRSPQEAKW
jgi:hypothetical protein